MRRRLITLLSAIVIGLGGGFLFALPAWAFTCSVGNICFYDGASYASKLGEISSGGLNNCRSLYASPYLWYNKVSSVYNNTSSRFQIYEGSSCPDTQYMLYVFAKSGLPSLPAGYNNFIGTYRRN
jgi:hypothetical protein